MLTPLFTPAGAFGGEIGTVARRCWALCGSQHGFHVLVASMFEMLERDFVQEGANYMEFNQALGRCETKMRSALTAAASCGSHVEVRNALGLPPFLISRSAPPRRASMPERSDPREKLWAQMGSSSRATVESPHVRGGEGSPVPNQSHAPP